LKTYKGGSSPLLNVVEWFYTFGGEKRGAIAFAICGSETAFGTTGNARKYYNCWGYMCNYEGIRKSCGWEYQDKKSLEGFIEKYKLQDYSLNEVRWIYAIKRYIDKATPRYLSKYDGTRKSIKAVSEAGYYKKGMDNATQQMIDAWVNRVYFFATKFQ